MTGRKELSTPDEIRLQLIDLLNNFEDHLLNAELRRQVIELIPANELLRRLGGS